MRRICAALDLPQAIPSRSSSRGRSDPSAVPDCGDVQAWWYTSYFSPVVGEESGLCPSSARYSLNVLEIGAGAGPSLARPDRAVARRPACGAAQHVTGRSRSPRGARADWMSATVSRDRQARWGQSRYRSRREQVRREYCGVRRAAVCRTLQYFQTVRWCSSWTSLEKGANFS